MQPADLGKEQKEALENVPVLGVQPKWYVIHIQTGYENKVKQALEQRIKSLGVEDKIFGSGYTSSGCGSHKKGKKTSAIEKVFPGYVLIRMILTDDSWLVVRTTEGVTDL